MSTAIKVDKFLNSFFKLSLKDSDKELYESVKDEFTRQQNHIELIASENIVSKAVLDAQGSIMTNKYAEGYPSAYLFVRTDPCASSTALETIFSDAINSI